MDWFWATPLSLDTDFPGSPGESGILACSSLGLTNIQFFCRPIRLSIFANSGVRPAPERAGAGDVTGDAGRIGFNSVRAPELLLRFVGAPSSCLKDESLPE